MGILNSSRAPNQVTYSAMRYFAGHPSPASRMYFLEVLADENAPWLQQLLSVQGLRRYDDPEVYAAVTSKITSSNWHVRVNAVEYAYSKGLSRDQINEILYKKDWYANESLLYQYRGDAEMTRYIIDTIQLLKQQDETAGGSPPQPAAALA